MVGETRFGSGHATSVTPIFNRRLGPLRLRKSFQFRNRNMKRRLRVLGVLDVVRVVRIAQRKLGGATAMSSIDHASDAATRLFAGGRLDEFVDAANQVGLCEQPILLRRRMESFAASTGDFLGSTFATDPSTSLVRVPCGNRVASKCVPCSRKYWGDALHLIRAGIVGGAKGVNEAVAENPLFFVALPD
jgi:hypothetical protein